jgi:hypothetical protein
MRLNQEEIYLTLRWPQNTGACLHRSPGCDKTHHGYVPISDYLIILSAQTSPPNNAKMADLCNLVIGGLRAEGDRPVELPV